jgi:coenzyme PQQ biosynthesis protein PqqD
MIDVASAVRLSPKARLRFDRHAQKYILLYPERGLLLSATAADIVRLCVETARVSTIVERLVEKYGDRARGTITEDVLRLLRTLEDRGLLCEVAP